MPTVINGIGTWYYGKRRIHTLKGICEFCGGQTNLVSYDTTLFFVVVFIPVLPLGRKRILQQCSACGQHRVLSLAKWEEAKIRDGGELLESLRDNPADRETCMKAIAFALAYQDEPLCNDIVATLGDVHQGDAAVQAQLGDAYSYFARWAEAERAYRNSLAAADDEIIREQLAWALLKQDCPDEARPYVQHVIDKRKHESAGTVYFLVKGYQAQGRHEEALAVMDERDQAFPDFAPTKEYQQQRKASTRYRGTQKRIRSDFLQEAGKTGYREGGWSSRLPRIIAALVIVGLLALYLGSAIWIGQSRKVYLVNGTGKPYRVVIQGKDFRLPPYAAFPVRLAEGDVQVEFKNAGLQLPPVQVRIESSFWTRPFKGHTFVINPDQAAIILEEETFYAAVNPPPGAPAVIHVGRASYSLPGVDFEFQEFPPTLQVKSSGETRKTRVGLATNVDPGMRLNMLQAVEPQEQVPFFKRLLRIDPDDTISLIWLTNRLSAAEALKFLETRLDDRPILVEWHRLYQSQIERTHPDKDLRPRYRKLASETKEHPDALYLLGRIEPDAEEADRLYRRAAAAKPPSGYGFYALAYRAISEARFAEARRLLEQALAVLTEKTMAGKLLQDALLAGGDYDRLLQLIQADAPRAGGRPRALIQMARVYAIRGDQAQARQKLAELIQVTPQDRAGQEREFNVLLAMCQNDVAGYLKAVGSMPSFEAALLRGELNKAADLAGPAILDADAFHGLLYLEATRTGNKQLADSQWQALLDELGKRGRDARLFANILTGKQPAKLALRLPIEPAGKRVLLAVLAQRQPGQARELLDLARRLNFQRDAISLCLQKHLAQP